VTAEASGSLDPKLEPEQRDPEHFEAERIEPERIEAVRHEPTNLEPGEVALELRDQVLGIQAQLDEIHARLDALEHRIGSRGRPRASLTRVRVRMRGLRAPRPPDQH
jgi:hypothetical protein